MSYNTVINTVFDWCVWILEVVAPRIGMTYNEINIWLFVIIHPLLTVGLFALVLHYRNRAKNERDRADLVNALAQRKYPTHSQHVA